MAQRCVILSVYNSSTKGQCSQLFPEKMSQDFAGHVLWFKSVVSNPRLLHYMATRDLREAVLL
jgi:hypothetical protein